jgi:hypothetical protein
MVIRMVYPHGKPLSRDGFNAKIPRKRSGYLVETDFFDLKGV